MTVGSAYFVVWRLGEVGGMECHFCDLAIALTRKGTDVTVLVEQPLRSDNRYARVLRQAGITVIVPSLTTRIAMRVEYRVLYRRATAWRRESPATFALLRALERRSRTTLPDIVHVHGCLLAQRAVLQWAKVRNIPAAYTEHVTLADWSGPHDAGSPDVFNDADAAIACVSERARESLSAYIHAPIAIATHIIDDPKITPCLPCTEGPLRLLTVGRLDACKGNHILLQAAAFLRDAGVSFTLTIAGDGEERAALERLCGRLNLNDKVTFAGLVEQKAIPALWAKADLGILASLTEGLPLALIEALAAGRPVVATKVGGIPETIVDGLEGFLVPPNDPNALAIAIARCTDHEMLADMGRAARSRFERGSWSSSDAVRQALELYGFAIDVRRNAPESFHNRHRKERLALAQPLSVAICTYRLSRGSAMDRRVIRQAIALSASGIAVTLHLERGLRPFDHSRRALERAGVRIAVPTVWAWCAGYWSSWTRRGAGTLPAALAQTIKRDRPEAVHIHGWQLATSWHALDQIARSLATLNIRTIYEEHSLFDQPARGQLTGVRSFDLLVAPSATGSANFSTALGGNHPPILNIAALDELASSPMHRSATASALKLFAVVDSPSRAMLIAARDLVIVGNVADADAVVLTPLVPGYATALIDAMASFTPVVLTKRDASGPIRHRVNGLIASDLAAAIEQIRADPLLAHQLAVGARRTYDDGAHDRLAIAAELAALYRPSSREAADARG